ncbi:unnamed protein product [Bursaphelenchus okinawaensis]|uniref:DUF4536 domain-containing protein n=1 Tax=Bursaphelenchus okinawaensis TaxID=465554 RepID=A0A811L996_9BILA|nr:unnamed protein product [Bursaphelenchus okinawaensis]CAG9120313.1 unnamed protein product [Bursaphelenchus okinawaensis]
MSQDLEKKLKQDCFECRITGTLTAFALGSYILYSSQKGRFVGGRGHQLFMRVFASGAFYMSAARWFYLPPFHKLLQD